MTENPTADFIEEEALVEQAVEHMGVTLAQGVEDTVHLTARLGAARDLLKQKIYEMGRWS